jgi:hypothetical protein
MHSRQKLILAFITTVMMAVPCPAQDVEPPFTWEDKGVPIMFRNVKLTLIH